MNPSTDARLSRELRRALVDAGITTREQLDRMVKSGALMSAEGVGWVLFREAEAWLRETSATETVQCPTCKGVGIIVRQKERKA